MLHIANKEFEIPNELRKKIIQTQPRIIIDDGTLDGRSSKAIHAFCHSANRYWPAIIATGIKKSSFSSDIRHASIPLTTDVLEHSILRDIYGYDRLSKLAGKIAADLIIHRSSQGENESDIRAQYRPYLKPFGHVFFMPPQ